MIEKSGSAHWSGTLREGSGQLSLQSGALSGAAYSFARRFGGEAGTNPEELIGAAHASCFAMAMSANLGDRAAGATIDATSTVSLDMAGAAPTVTKVHVVVRARIPDMTPEAFAEVAARTKEGCPISRLLAGSAEITMDAALA